MSEDSGDQGLAALQEEFPLPAGNQGAPWLLVEQNGGGDAQNAIRLYQMWLAGALQKPGAPALDPAWDPWRVSSFWICATLMMHLSLPVNDVSLEDTRITFLLRVYLFVSGDHLTVDEQSFVHIVARMQEAVPEAQTSVCVDLLVHFMSAPDTVTPELSDIAFERIIQATPRADLQRYVEQTTVNYRAFRIKRFAVPSEAKGNAVFLSQVPPPPRVSLQERSMSGAAYLSDKPLDERFAHIFRYPVTLWE